jgi:hypothetical protein
MLKMTNQLCCAATLAMCVLGGVAHAQSTLSTQSQPFQPNAAFPEGASVAHAHGHFHHHCGGPQPGAGAPGAAAAWQPCGQHAGEHEGHGDGAVTGAPVTSPG